MGEHRTVFTSDEVLALKALVREKQTAAPDRQKAVRNTMRKEYGFYISKVFRGGRAFVESDLDDLIARGTITVRDRG
jgi:hypothetical protein